MLVFCSSVPLWLCHQTVCLLWPVQKRIVSLRIFHLIHELQPRPPASSHPAEYECGPCEKKKIPSRQAFSRNPRQHNRLSHDKFYVFFLPLFSLNQHFCSTFSFHPGAGQCEINPRLSIEEAAECGEAAYAGQPDCSGIPPSSTTQTCARKRIKAGPAGLRASGDISAFEKLHCAKVRRAPS